LSTGKTASLCQSHHSQSAARQHVDNLLKSNGKAVEDVYGERV